MRPAWNHAKAKLHENLPGWHIAPEGLGLRDGRAGDFLCGCPVHLLPHDLRPLLKWANECVAHAFKKLGMEELGMATGSDVNMLEFKMGKSRLNPEP